MPGRFDGPALVALLLATAGEGAALLGWLSLLAADRWWAANLVLWAGFAVERGAIAWWLRRAHPKTAPINTTPITSLVAGLFLATVVEIATWIGWRWSAQHWNIEIAALLLFVAIHGLHAEEMASVRGRPVAEILVRRRTLLFSLVEALGATAWLALTRAGQPVWGGVAMVTALAIEHVVQGMQLHEEEFRP